MQKLNALISVFSKLEHCLGDILLIEEGQFDPETMSKEDPRNSESDGDQPKKRKAKSQDSEQQEEPAQPEQSDVH